MIHVNKIENRITFKIEAGYYLELLTHETTKLHSTVAITNIISHTKRSKALRIVGIPIFFNINNTSAYVH